MYVNIDDGPADAIYVAHVKTSMLTQYSIFCNSTTRKTEAHIFLHSSGFPCCLFNSLIPLGGEAFDIWWEVAAVYINRWLKPNKSAPPLPSKRKEKGKEKPCIYISWDLLFLEQVKLITLRKSHSLA